MRGLESVRTATVIITGHAFIQNLRRDQRRTRYRQASGLSTQRCRVRRTRHSDLTASVSDLLPKTSPNEHATAPFEHFETTRRYGISPTSMETLSTKGNSDVSWPVCSELRHNSTTRPRNDGRRVPRNANSPPQPSLTYACVRTAHPGPRSRQQRPGTALASALTHRPSGCEPSSAAIPQLGRTPGSRSEDSPLRHLVCSVCGSADGYAAGGAELR